MEEGTGFVAETAIFTGAAIWVLGNGERRAEVARSIRQGALTSERLAEVRDLIAQVLAEAGSEG